MNATNKILAGSLFYTMQRNHELMNKLNAHLGVDVRLAGDSLPIYLTELKEYLENRGLNDESMLEELDAVRSVISSSPEDNLILNLPLIFHYHRQAMSEYAREQAAEHRRRLEERQNETRRAMMKKLSGR